MANPNTAVKTIVNQLNIADLGITAADSPCTVNKGVAAYDGFFASIEALTGQKIDAMEMVVKVTESYGAEIGATGEIPIVYNYVLESLEGTVDGTPVSYAK